MQGLPPPTEIERSYRILELDPESSSALVDSSWRKLADEWRPDRFVGDPLLQARAEARVNDLNRAHELVKRHLASERGPSTHPSVPINEIAQSRLSFRRLLVAATGFSGLAIAAVLIADPLSGQKLKPAPVSHPSGDLAARPVAPAVALRSEFTLVALAPLTVSAALVEDGRILLPETTLHAGQTTTVPRLGATYIRYSSGENLEVEIDGHRHPMPTTGASRAKIN